MSKVKIYVDCARGYSRSPFDTPTQAQAWIDAMTDHHARDERMCPGPHTIREEGSDGDLAGTSKGVASGS